MFMYFIKLDKQTTDFLFKGQEDSYANLKFRSGNVQLK